MSTPSFFGRVWKVTVDPQASGEHWVISNSDWDSEALRVTFAIEQIGLPTYWFADIAIYNCTAAMQQVIQQGDPVTIEAGYQSPGTGLIFSGRVFQPIWEREGETDYKLTLHCMLGLYEDQNGYVSVSLASPAANPLTLGQAVRQVAKAAGRACVDANLDPSLDAKTLPRGLAYAGPATKFFVDVAKDNNLNYWLSPQGVNLRSLAPQGTEPNVVYAPALSSTAQVSGSDGLTKYTLIGTPQQTEQGCTFRTLLDSQVQLVQLVKLDQALLRKILLYPGQPAIWLDKDGLFVVGGIRHFGDTRGNDWYTEIVGVTREFAKLTGVTAR
jgi:hypothetical protein